MFEFFENLPKDQKAVAMAVFLIIMGLVVNGWRAYKIGRADFQAVYEASR